MELLAVMAVIGLLSAISFPALQNIRLKSSRNSDISSMKEIWAGLIMYKEDHGYFPESLAGHATVDSTNNNELKVTKTLYPKYVKSIQAFKPSQLKETFLTSASNMLPNFFPHKNNNTEQAFHSSDGFAPLLNLTTTSNPNQRRTISTLPQNKNSPNVKHTYKFSGYDAIKVPYKPRFLANNQEANELRYTLYWSTKAIKYGGSPTDNPRQLGYYNPPSNTIVTWNSSYRKWKNNIPDTDSKDLVLYLNGHIEIVSSLDMFQYSWSYIPRE